MAPHHTLRHGLDIVHPARSRTPCSSVRSPPRDGVAVVVLSVCNGAGRG